MNVISKTSGFSLLEVLIALVVISIGVLGLAGLQAQGLRFNHDAYVRTQATLLANDLMDRMRTRTFTMQNAAALEAELQAFTIVPGAPGACNPTDTTPAGEMNCWTGDVLATLPGAIAPTVAQTQGAGTAGIVTDDAYTITLTWGDRSSPGTNVTQTWEFQP